MGTLVCRRIGIALFIVFFFSVTGCDEKTTHPPLSAPETAYSYTPSAADATGGPSAPPVSMSGNALTLANLIINYRAQAGLDSGTNLLQPNDILAGVAQWHANDMANNSYVGLVGSDGEDVYNRLTNSGYANKYAGAIADGYSTDPQAVFNEMITNYSSNSVLLFSGQPLTSIGVGYSNGYWMVILGQ